MIRQSPYHLPMFLFDRQKTQLYDPSSMSNQPNNNLISRIAGATQLQHAYRWLRKKRIHSHHNNVFWSISRSWSDTKQRLRQRLQAGDYTLSPVQQITLNDGNTVSQWGPEDAIVLKAMANLLTPYLHQRLNLSHATHLKGNGGLKQAVTTTHALTKQYRNGFVIKTDIANYYASIQHHILYAQLYRAIKDVKVCRLLWQVMNRVNVSNGHHRLIRGKSITRGCPLSPLLAAIYLLPLDDLMRQQKVRIVRYMDDFVIFTKTRHHCRRTLKALYQVLKPLGLTLAATKTFIGRVSKGFDFLGYRITPRGLTCADITIWRMQQRYGRLYEQGASATRLDVYVKHWIRWVHAGIPKGLMAIDITRHSNTIEWIRVKE